MIPILATLCFVVIIANVILQGREIARLKAQLDMYKAECLEDTKVGEDDDYKEFCIKDDGCD